MANDFRKGLQNGTPSINAFKSTAKTEVLAIVVNLEDPSNAEKKLI